MHSLESIGLIGCGGMGADIAVYLASVGFNVNVYVRTPESRANALERLRNKAENFAVITANPAVSGLVANVQVHVDLKELQGCKIILESIPENRAMKVQLFQNVQKILGESVLLLSNTSSIDLSSMAAELEAPKALMGLNWWNPAMYLPLVELVRTPHNLTEDFEQVQAFLAKSGKRAITVERPIAGYIGNRLQFALLREAAQLYSEGLASIEDIDNAVKHGFGLRLAMFGPFEVATLGGSKDFLTIANNLFGELSNADCIDDKTAALMREDQLHSKEKQTKMREERDRRIHELVCLLNAQRGDL